nr:hypothetical protein [Tanacetum cinerariifolium]
IALVSTHDDVSTQDNIVQDEGIEDVGEEEVVEVVTTAKMIIDVVVDVAQVTTAIANIPVSAAKTIVTIAPTITTKSTKTNVEVTQATKRKGVMIQESLKKKSFAEIHELFDKAMKKINTFFNFRTKLVEKSTKKDEAKTAQESRVNIPQSDKDRLKHIKLMKICTILQNKVLNLEDELKRTKTAQQTKIDGLERKVKKLEKKYMSRTHKLKRLYKVGLTDMVISSSDDEALDKEDTSK